MRLLQETWRKWRCCWFSSQSGTSPGSPSYGLNFCSHSCKHSLGRHRVTNDAWPVDGNVAALWLRITIPKSIRPASSLPYDDVWSTITSRCNLNSRLIIIVMMTMMMMILEGGFHSTLARLERPATCTRASRYWCSDSMMARQFASRWQHELTIVLTFSFSTQFLNTLGIIFVEGKNSNTIIPIRRAAKSLCFRCGLSVCVCLRVYVFVNGLWWNVWRDGARDAGILVAIQIKIWIQSSWITGSRNS